MLKYLKIMFLAVAMFVLVACGGGGNSEGNTINLPSKPEASQMAKLDDTNASNIAFLVLRLITDDTGLDILNPGFLSSSNLEDSNAKKINRFSRLYHNECDRGSLDINVNESKKSAVFTFNNCIDNGTAYNGKITAYYYSESEFDAYYENVTIKNSLISVEIPKAKIYFMDNEPHEMENTYMYVKLKNGNEFKYFNFNAKEYGDEYSFSGYVKPTCLDAYVFAKSEGKININDNSAKGEFSVSSLGKEIKVDLDNDLIFVNLPNKKEEAFAIEDILKAIKKPGCDIEVKATIPYRPKSSDFVSFGDEKKNTKIASAAFNSTINIKSKFSLIADIYNDLDMGLSCTSGTVQEIDNGNKIKAIYKNCKIDANTTYTGEINFTLEDGAVAKMELKNLQIKYNNKSAFIKYATVAKVEDDYSNVSFKISNIYATIDGSEYLNFSFEHGVDFDNNIDFTGYVKPKCLGKFINLVNSTYYYDYESNNLDDITLYIYAEPYYKNSEEDLAEWISVNLGVEKKNIIIDSPGSYVELSVQDFINKCK